MKKKYKIKYKSIIIIIFLILVILCCIRFFSKGHSITYKIGEEKYEVKEIYTKGEKNEIDNYYLEVTVADIPFGFQFYHTFSKKRKILEDIITYEGDYVCVLPIIEGKAITDLLCYQDNRYYFYHSIVGNDSNLDKFVNEIDSSLYMASDWEDNSTNTEVSSNITLYSSNLVENHILSISSLKGLYRVSESVQTIDIFSQDIYDRKLSAYVSNYYVTADYSQSQQFRIFYIVDLKTGKIEEAKSPNYISFDSYIQGIVDGKLYIYDLDNEKQYSINPTTKKIEEVGNSKKKIQYYENGEWSKITTTKANKELLFDMSESSSDFQKFYVTYHIGGEESGYYYFFMKMDDGYILYRAPSQNPKIITYITEVTDIDDVYFLDDYIYYQTKDSIQYYHDEKGVRTVLKYKELEFNKNLIFGVAEK